MNGQKKMQQDPQPVRSEALGGRIVAGASLYIAANVAVRLLGLVSVAVLGRLLTPGDFGLIALAMVVVGLSDALANRQFELALVRAPTMSQAHVDTAFTLALMWGALSGGVIFAFAGPIAKLMGEPALVEVLQWLALLPVLNNLSNPHFAMFQRALRFGPGNAVSVIAKVVSTAVAVGAAYMLGDHRAMVAAALSYAALRTVLTYTLIPGPVRLGLGRWREFLGFGIWLSAASALEFVNQKMLTAFVGGWLGVRAAGLLHMGTELAQIPTQQLADPLMRAVYPGFSAIVSEPERLRAAYYKAQATILGVLLPAGVGVALTARETIVLAIGPKWLEATPALQVLAPAMAISVLAAGVQAVTMAQGDTRSVFLRNVVVMAIQLPVLLVGYALGGFVGVLAARAGVMLLQTVLTLRIARRITGDGTFAVLYAARRSFIACAAMTGSVLAASPLLPAATTEPLATGAALAAKAALGATVYVATHLALWFGHGRPDGFERLGAAVLSQIATRRRA